MSKQINSGSTKPNSDAQNALKKFELENEIQDDKDFYNWDQNEVDKFYDAKAWKKGDEHYFKNVKISSTALIKMVMHTKSGGNIEVMGLFQGKIIGDTFMVMDSFALPVEASETRVRSTQEGEQYQIDHTEFCEEVNRPEYVFGWYHSHPGYGCWMSGIDVQNQINLQKLGPFLAIVIDPYKTMSAGKVELGCYRTYSANEIAKREAALSKDGGVSGPSVPIEKIQELGAHYHKYYQLEHQFVKSKQDDLILNRLWNEYWLATLSSSPLLNNQKEITNRVLDINLKIQETSKSSGNAMVIRNNDTRNQGYSGQRPGRSGGKKGRVQNLLDQQMDDGGMDIMHGYGGSGGQGNNNDAGLSDKVYQSLQKVEGDSSKIACECNHGLMVEAMKRFMFTKNVGPIQKSSLA